MVGKVVLWCWVENGGAIAPWVGGVGIVRENRWATHRDPAPHRVSTFYLSSQKSTPPQS